MQHKTLEISKATIAYDIHPSEIESDASPILFLHGMLGTKEQFTPLRPYFSDRTVITLDFPSHGASTTTREALTTQDLASDVLEFLSALDEPQVDIIGYSLGGYVALEMALVDEARIKSIISHAMKFYWTDDAIDSSLAELTAEAIGAKSSRALGALDRMHASNPLEKTLALSRSTVSAFRERQLSAGDVLQGGVPLLLSVGDRDELVPLEEVLKLYQAIGTEQASLAVHADTRHPFHLLPVESFARAAATFWKGVEATQATQF